MSSGLPGSWLAPRRHPQYPQGRLLHGVEASLDDLAMRASYLLPHGLCSHQQVRFQRCAFLQAVFGLLCNRCSADSNVFSGIVSADKTIVWLPNEPLVNTQYLPILDCLGVVMLSFLLLGNSFIANHSSCRLLNFSCLWCSYFPCSCS